MHNGSIARNSLRVGVLGVLGLGVFATACATETADDAAETSEAQTAAKPAADTQTCAACVDVNELRQLQTELDNAIRALDNGPGYVVWVDGAFTAAGFIPGGGIVVKLSKALACQVFKYFKDKEKVSRAEAQRRLREVKAAIGGAACQHPPKDCPNTTTAQEIGVGAACRMVLHSDAATPPPANTMKLCGGTAAEKDDQCTNECRSSGAVCGPTDPTVSRECVDSCLTNLRKICNLRGAGPGEYDRWRDTVNRFCSMRGVVVKTEQAMSK